MPTRILIAEDNPVVRSALRQLLENAGDWEIIEVANGRQAVTQAQERKPNLIILDLVMPIMDGLVAARELSKIMPDVPMLMHTLHWSPQMELEAQKVGVRKVVPKADARGLVSSIQELLSAAPTATVKGISETVPAPQPPPEITALPPITDSESAKPATDTPGAPKATAPDDTKESSPPT